MHAMLVGDLSPHGWAISVSYGIAAGLFPIIGPVSIVSILVVWLFRMHLPLVLLLVYGLYPIQLALMVPFGLIGKQLLPSTTFRTTNTSADFEWFYALGDWALAALVGWSLIIIPLGLLCYRISLRFARNKKLASLASLEQ